MKKGTGPICRNGPKGASHKLDLSPFSGKLDLSPFSRKGTADPDFRSFLQKHQTDVREISPEEITDRLFLVMLLEATRALEENVVREPADVDMGLILGVGFPTFRGGILRWCDTEGAARILQRVERYTPLGKRFQPTDSLQRLARSASQFYPRP